MDKKRKSPGFRPSAGQDPAKRRQILDGAKGIFQSLGFDAASMNDIAEAANVSKSTLYVYFRSKEELFAALVGRERDRYFEEIRKIFTDPTRPEETLRAYGLKLATMLSSTQVVRAHRIVIAVAERMPSIGWEFYEEGPVRAVALLASYLKAAVAAGTLEIPDASRAATQFIELSVAGLHRARLFNHTPSDPTPDEITEAVDSAVRLFMAGYGAGDRNAQS